MAAMSSRGPAGSTSHQEFYLQWIMAQERYLLELETSLESDMKEPELAILVSRVLEHYREYYEAKKTAAKQNVLQVMAPSWRNPLENALLWLGGWRPTVVFQLAYAEAGHQLEAELEDLLENTDSATMASLSPEQLSTISDLQIKTVERENELSRRMAVLQQGLANEPLVSLARTEATAESSQQSADQQEEKPKTVRGFVNCKLRALEELLIDADNLRLETLDKMLKVLTVFQSAQYLVAAGHLRICIRRMGQSL